MDKDITIEIWQSHNQGLSCRPEYQAEVFLLKSCYEGFYKRIDQMKHHIHCKPYFQLLPVISELLQSKAYVDVLEVHHYHGLDIAWNVVELQRKGNE